jgi:hypothetical protein
MMQNYVHSIFQVFNFYLKRYSMAYVFKKYIIETNHWSLVVKCV